MSENTVTATAAAVNTTDKCAGCGNQFPSQELADFHCVGCLEVNASIGTDYAEALNKHTPQWATATAEQKRLLVEDMAHCVGQEGLSAVEYLQGIREFGSLADYLAEIASNAPVEPAAEPAAAVVEDLAAKQAALEAEREAMEKASAKTLSQAVTAFGKGVTEHAKWTIEAGRLCDIYIRQRLALGIPRGNAALKLAGEFASCAREKIDVPYIGRLIRTYHAHRLLAVEAGVDAKLTAKVPYTHYRDAWIQLTQTVNEGKADEHYVLLPGLEDRCREVFAKAMAAEMPKEGVQRDVTALHSEFAKAQKAIADAEKAIAAKEMEAAKAKYAAENAALQAKRAEEQEAAKAERERMAEAKRLEDAAKAATVAEERERLAKEAAEAKAKADAAAEVTRLAAVGAKDAWDAREKAVAEANAATKALNTAVAAADATATTADKAGEKAEKAAAKAEGRKVTVTPKTPEPTAAAAPANLQSVAKSGTAKDVAAMAAELVEGCEAPDDMLHALLLLLKDSKELSKVSKRAIDAALVGLSPPARPKVANVA